MLTLKRKTEAGLYLIAALTASTGGTQAIASTTASAGTGPSILAAADEHHSDTLITTRVKAELLKANFMTGLDVKVSTHDGVVQLAGYVDKAEQVRLAETIASGVDGVQRVQNDLRIK